MNSTEKLICIHIALNSPYALDAKDLADNLEINLKTVKNSISKLCNEKYIIKSSNANDCNTYIVNNDKCFGTVKSIYKNNRYTRGLEDTLISKGFTNKDELNIVKTNA